MKKIFSLILAISILAGGAAPSFAQKRNTRNYCPPTASPWQPPKLPPLPKFAASLGTVLGIIFNPPEGLFRSQPTCVTIRGRGHSRLYCD